MLVNRYIGALNNPAVLLRAASHPLTSIPGGVKCAVSPGLRLVVVHQISPKVGCLCNHTQKHYPVSVGKPQSRSDMADVYAHEEQQERRALVQRSYQTLKRWFMSNDKLQGKYGKLPSFWQEFIGWEHERSVWKRYTAHQDGVELPFSDAETEDSKQEPASAEGEGPLANATQPPSTTDASMTESSGTAQGEQVAGKKRRRFGAPRFAPTGETPSTSAGAANTTELGAMQKDTEESSDLVDFAKAGMAAAAALKLKKPKRRRFAEKDEFDQTLDKLTDFAKSNRFQQLALGPAGVLEIQEEVNRICGEGGLHAFLLRATAREGGASSNPALQALKGLLGQGDASGVTGPASDKATRKQQIQQELARLHDQLNDIPATIKVLRAQPNRPPSPTPEYDEHGKRTNTLELRLAAEINDQKSVLIEELLDCDPALQRMKEAGIIAGPSKREKPSRKLYIPLKEHPEFNFMGVIIGPRGVNQKRLETETGCRISVRGRGTERPGKPIDKDSINDDMHVFIQGDNERQVEAAAEKVAKLLVPRYDEEWKEEQMKQVAIINGTYKKTSIVAVELPKMNYNMASELEKILDTVGEGAAKQEAKLKYGRQTAGLDAIPDDDDDGDDDGYKAYLQQLKSSQGLAAPSASGPDAATGASKAAPLVNASVVAAAPAFAAAAGPAVGTMGTATTAAAYVPASTQAAPAAPATPAVWTMPSLDEQRKAKEAAAAGPAASMAPAAPQPPLPPATHTHTTTSAIAATGGYAAPATSYAAASGAMAYPGSVGYSAPYTAGMPATGGYAAQAPMPHMGMGMYGQYGGGGMQAGYGYPQPGMPQQGMYAGGFAQPGFGMAPSALQQSMMGRGGGMQTPYMGQFPGMQGYGMPGGYAQQPVWPGAGMPGGGVGAPPPPPPPPPPPQQ